MYCRIKGKKEKEKIIATFFCGELPGESMQKTGSLNLTVGQWQILMAALFLGAEETHDHLKLQIIDPLKGENDITKD